MPSASEKSNAFSVEKTFNPKLKYFPQSSKKYETTVCKLKKKKNMNKAPWKRASRNISMNQTSKDIKYCYNKVQKIKGGIIPVKSKRS